MKLAISALVLLAAFAATSASVAVQTAARPAEQIQISGKDYLRLTDWAKANSFEAHWLKHDETLELSNHSSRLRFNVDSSEAEINGVAVWLLWPIALRNGSVYIAHQDLQNTLRPILVLPQKRPGTGIKTICLDAGHGGKDPGFKVGSTQEKKYTLLLAQELRQQLTRAGFFVTLTRTTDKYVERAERPDWARRRKADLFVSLHFNATETSAGSVKGAEVYCMTPAGASSTNSRGEGGDSGAFAGNRCNERNLLLAYQVQKSLTRNLAVEDRGVRRARFEVLRDAIMPAVLIEAGFLSHPAEGRKIIESAYRKQMARAILEGVQAYKRLVETAG
jgi:N-acetylmuramoyl-L-alanine amidase